MGGFAPSGSPDICLVRVRLWPTSPSYSFLRPSFITSHSSPSQSALDFLQSLPSLSYRTTKRKPAEPPVRESLEPCACSCSRCRLFISDRRTHTSRGLASLLFTT